ncbi:hypothetical protein DFH06DRAFT_263445 [Mycena polygramma]|nr:hypothetical protein DFH06DRAFT_263445 [Mycena polygramma]
MSAYKSFAVVGGGRLGLPIVNALAARDVSIILLSRPGSSAKTVPATVEVVEVDYSNAAATATVLKEHKIDAVISTIGKVGVSAQKPLVDAAKLAAVKLFVPSEFGAATDGPPESASITAASIGDKYQIAEYLKSLNIPSVRIFNGVFIELVPWLTGYAEHGKIRIVGKGEEPVSFTSISDIAGFVAHVLTTLSPSELENRLFRLEGERLSLNELGPLFKTSVEHVDRITGPAGDVKTELFVLFSKAGAGTTGWDETNQVERSGADAAGSANALWSGHYWRSIKEVHNL